MSSEASSKDSISNPRAASREQPFPRSYVIILVCAILAGAVLTAAFIYQDYRGTVRHAQALLTRSSEETANALRAWLRSTSKQATVIASFPAIARAVGTNSPAARAHASDVVDHFRGPFFYSAIYAVDVSGATRVQSSGAPPLPDWLRNQAQKNTVPRILTCYDSAASSSSPQLAILVPIHGSQPGADRPLIGTLIILTERDVLAAHVGPQGADLAIRSMLIGRGPHGEVVYLSRLQHPPPPGAAWHDNAAEAAVNGETRFLLRQAGDGTIQYVVTRPLPEFGWGIVSRQSRAEVLEPVRRTAVIAFFIFLVGASLLVTFAIAIWRHQQVHGLRAEVRRRAVIEEELRQSEERFNKTFRSCPEGMTLSTMRDGRFLEVNDSFVAIFGYSREEIIGHTSFELEMWADPKDREKLMLALLRNELVRNWRIRGRVKRGAAIEVELSAEVVPIQGELCLLLVLRDITHQILLEEQLRQAQKMEAIGRLAGGIAHDFNNVLAVISLSCEMLADELNGNEQQARKLQIMRNACERAAGLTRQLLTFSRQQVLQPKVIELNAVVLETQKLLERVIGEDIQIQLELCEAPAFVCMDVGQLVQVLMNLAVNARDAMPDGGRITIRTGHCTRPPQTTRQNSSDGPYAVLSVLDTGTGISPNIREHIFEPFFTTKKEGEGTGLGLSTVYGVVRQSGGQVLVESELGDGAAFHVYLPEVSSQPAETETKPAEEKNGHAAKILLVEDDQAIRRLARDLLQTAGYKVLEAADGMDALEIFTSRPDSVDLVLTDVVMPRMNGRALAEAVRARAPRTKILFMSAYSETYQPLSDSESESTGFIQKPFGRPELLGKIQALLSESEHHA